MCMGQAGGESRIVQLIERYCQHGGGALGGGLRVCTLHPRKRRPEVAGDCVQAQRTKRRVRACAQCAARMPTGPAPLQHHHAHTCERRACTRDPATYPGEAQAPGARKILAQATNSSRGPSHAHDHKARNDWLRPNAAGSTTRLRWCTHHTATLSPFPTSASSLACQAVGRMSLSSSTCGTRLGARQTGRRPRESSSSSPTPPRAPPEARAGTDLRPNAPCRRAGRPAPSAY